MALGLPVPLYYGINGTAWDIPLSPTLYPKIPNLHLVPLYHGINRTAWKIPLNPTLYHTIPSVHPVPLYHDTWDTTLSPTLYLQPLVFILSHCTMGHAYSRFYTLEAVNTESIVTETFTKGEG